MPISSEDIREALKKAIMPFASRGGSISGFELSSSILRELSRLLLREKNTPTSPTYPQSPISTGAMATNLPPELLNLIQGSMKIWGGSQKELEELKQTISQFTQESIEGARALEPQIESQIRAAFAQQRSELMQIGRAQEAGLDFIQSQMAPYAFAATSYENYKASIRRDTVEALAKLDALEQAALAGAKINLFEKIQALKAQALANYINLVNTSSQNQLNLLNFLSGVVMSAPQYIQSKAIAEATPELLELQKRQTEENLKLQSLNQILGVLNPLLEAMTKKSSLTPNDKKTLSAFVGRIANILGIKDTKTINNIIQSLATSIINQKPQALFSVQSANEILIIGQNPNGTIGVLSRIPYTPPSGTISPSQQQNILGNILEQKINDVLRQFFGQ